MKIIYFRIVFLFEYGLRMVLPDGSASSTFDYSRPPSSYFRPQKSSGPVDNPCDRRKVSKGAPDAHEACHSECMRIKKLTNEFSEENSGSEKAESLNSKCGSVKKGVCDYLRSVSFYPICWCYYPDKKGGQRRIFAFLCRLRLPVRRTLTSLKRSCTPNFRPKSPKITSAGNMNKSVLQSAKWGGFVKCFRLGKDLNGEMSAFKWKKPDPGILVTDFEISGEKVQAIVDTGSGFTLIHRRFANDITKLEQPVILISVSKNKVEYWEETTIDVQISEDISISVTGLVTDTEPGFILGNDFNVRNKVKIKISEGTMEISTGQTEVKLFIYFSATTETFNLLESDDQGYSPLMIAAFFHGHHRKITIDTGASFNAVDTRFVSPSKIRSKTNVKCVADDDTTVRFYGETSVRFLIGYNEFKTTAMAVPVLDDCLLVGNGFNKQYIELIDFEYFTVTLRLPRSNNRIEVQAFVRYEL